MFLRGYNLRGDHWIFFKNMLREHDPIFGIFKGHARTTIKGRRFFKNVKNEANFKFSNKGILKNF